MSGVAATPTTIAVVPLKALAAAKGRLAQELDPERRRELVRWMFSRTIAACCDAAAIARVLAVVGDDEGAALAAEHGAEVLRDSGGGLQEALALADAATRDAAATMVVAADVPLVTGADLDRVWAAGGDAADAAVVVAPTSDGGTGALLRRPPGVIPTAFGPGSAAAHLALAARAGVRAVSVDVPALALDVDTPHSLRLVASALADYHRG
ncbi:MAG TPA: 2-phospho-L-lactate guanylyltransferase [Egibacteraceae bacterium]